jgi:hypothetical protein
MKVELVKLGDIQLPYISRRDPVELTVSPEPYFLRPCTESLELYRLQREEWRLKGHYKPGVIIPLDSDQEGLWKIYMPNNGDFPESQEAKLDVYNATEPFEVEGGKIVIAGRVQPPGNPYSKVLFFEQKDNEWKPLTNVPIFDLEDPFITYVDNQIIFGGVSVVKLPTEIKYQTVFYKGTCLEDLTEFIRGPFGMKDIRLVQLADQRIGLFTRPQGEIGGLGQIGFTTIDSLAQLTTDVITNTPLIAQRFPQGEWGGVNKAYALSDGRIFAIGHRAYFDEAHKKCYYSWAFIHDPETGISEDLGIIAASDDFPDTDSRDDDTKNVTFPTGIDWGKRNIHLGARDSRTVILPIPGTA